MPVVKVWCLPPKQTEDELNNLHKLIVAAVVSVPEIGLESKDDMTCLFIPDLMEYGLGEEIIVEISGLSRKFERTREVLQRLAKNTGEAVGKLYPKAKKVECFVTIMDPLGGFWTSVDQTEWLECYKEGPGSKCEPNKRRPGYCDGCGG